MTPFSRELPVLRDWAQRRVLEPDRLHPALVVERDGVVDGYAVCRIIDTPDDGMVRLAPPGGTEHLLSVGVTELARGRGVGSALVAARLAAVGATRLSAAFVPRNPTAAPFWRGRGFVPRWTYWAGVVG